jgi:chitinase
MLCFYTLLHRKLVLLSFIMSLILCNSVIALSMRRELPEKVLIGYANNCDEKVVNAVREGVNVVVWAFLELQNAQDTDDGLVPVTSLDLKRVQDLIRSLDDQGYEDTVHLISFGGWNGPHLETSGGITPEEWYRVWKQHAGDIFHGIDWDLEGHDDLASPTNLFSRDCLEFVGQISRMAKKDGYIIGMAPPQSYLDIHNPNFSRSVNLTESDRPWHNEFHYFGANVYSYLLAKYGDSIDFVSVQFYESYSRAAIDIYHYKKSPSEYLESYVRDLVANNQSFNVNFEDDPSLEFSTCRISFPLSKLVLGFANGWAKDSGDKTLYVEPEELASAYNKLHDSGIAPRGFMYWVITEEGTKKVQYTRDLNKILNVRPLHEESLSTENEL